MKTRTYRIHLIKEPDGGFTASVPTLSGCITFGKSVDEAMEMVKEAISLYIESLEAHGEAVPDDQNTLEYSLTLVA